MALYNEVNAALRLKESLLAHYPDLKEEDQALWDTIEGETDVLEALAKVISSALLDESWVIVLKSQKEALNDRQTRFKARAESKRNTVKAIMELLNLPKLERPEFTVSIGKKQPSLIITDETRIDSKYFTTPEPVLNRKQLIDDLKSGHAVDGVELSNGGASLRIATR